MRSTLLIGLLVASSSAACSSASGGGGSQGIGDPCDATSQLCAEGGSCDYSSATPTCLDDTADPDGDGIPNKLDHCPTKVGGMFDEDNDGIGDECDRCPIAKPSGVADRDGDDVDSPCDPDPSTPGDKILLFDGFNGTLDTTRWTPDITGVWTVQGGELVARLPTQDPPSFLTANVVPTANVSVQMSYRVDKVETGGPTHIVSAQMVDVRPAGVAGFDCGVVKSDIGTAGEVVDLETDLSAVSHVAAIGAFDSARLYRSAAYASGATVGCVVIGDNTALAAIQGTLTPDSLGTVKVTARAVTARYQWVLVVGHANATSAAN